MTIKVDVDCANDECDRFIDYVCESENAGEGSEHKVTCACGTTTKFTIGYMPVACDEVEDE